MRGLWDGDEEARLIGDEIEALPDAKAKGSTRWPSWCAPRFQMRAFEERFITLGVPYRVIGGPRFYERAEIRDALAYLKVAASARR